MATSSIYRPGSVEESYAKIFSPINTGVSGGRAYSDTININSTKGKVSLKDQLDQAALDLANLNLASASQIPSSYDAQKAQLDLLAAQQAYGTQQLAYLGEQQRQQQALRSEQLEQQKFGLSKRESTDQLKSSRVSRKSAKQQMGLNASADLRAADAAALAKQQGQQQMQLDALASQRAGTAAGLANQQTTLQNNALMAQQGIMSNDARNAYLGKLATTPPPMPAYAQKNAQTALAQGYPVQAAYSSAFTGGPQAGMNPAFANPYVLASQQQNSYLHDSALASQGINPAVATNSMYRAIGGGVQAPNSGNVWY